jgi:hypothetical protein
MNIEPIYIYFAIGIVLLISLSYFFSEEVRIKRIFKKAPFKLMSDFKDGEVAKVIGNIISVEEPLIAPLSGRKCVQYQIIVEKDEGGSEEGSRYEVIIDDTVKSKFLIKDGDYLAMINDPDLKSLIEMDKEYSSGFLKDAESNLEVYLKSHGKQSENFFGFNKKLRYKEGILALGEEVAVYGSGNWKKATELNLPVALRSVLEFRSTPKSKVYLSDHAHARKR